MVKWTLKEKHQHQGIMVKTEPKKFKSIASAEISCSREACVNFDNGDKNNLARSWGRRVSNQINSPNMEATARSQTYHFLEWKQTQRGWLDVCSKLLHSRWPIPLCLLSDLIIIVNLSISGSCCPPW